MEWARRQLRDAKAVLEDRSDEASQPLAAAADTLDQQLIEAFPPTDQQGEVHVVLQERLARIHQEAGDRAGASRVVPVAAPVTPLEGPAEIKLEATADLRRGHEVEGGVLCMPRRCDPRPFEPTICCCYGQGDARENPLGGRPPCVMA